jgi:dienelactone hydrolase
MSTCLHHFSSCCLLLALSTTAAGQAYGEADRGAPGDQMIQDYLAAEAQRLDDRFLQGISSQDDWEKCLGEYREQYLYMLGLSPLPSRTPLKATVTGTYEGDGFVVEKLHYQSQPQLYVTANLYRPAGPTTAARRPAVLYVCGHSHCGRNGNKVAYQSHGIWLARHGTICLVVDTLQLGEIAATHHGTYREGRWWWHARGYTSAGVECWNGIRGIDYLVSRDDVDPERLAVTGISGGGAATFWIAAADPRVKVAVPVSGMADLPSYVGNRVVNGHCDCMFLYNAFAWPWTRIAALIAPRPLLFVNSDQDAIFPMDANERVSARLERLYSLYGAGDLVDSVVSMGGHAYRRDIRRAALRFLNTHLHGDPQPITDSEVDLVDRSAKPPHYPIEPTRLRVFLTDDDLPADERNTTIDRTFVPLADVRPPVAGDFDAWRKRLVDQLRQNVFGYFPTRIPAATRIGQNARQGGLIETQRGIRVPLAKRSESTPLESVRRVVLWAREDGFRGPLPAWLKDRLGPSDRLYQIAPRGVGPTRWTHRNPPNYVRRAHVLLGQTVDSGRIWDLIAASRLLRSEYPADVSIVVAGQRGAAVLGVYAALWEKDIDAVLLQRPQLTHADADAPQLLNVLRVCDVPDAIGMLAPRAVTIVGTSDQRLERIRAIYRAADAAGQFRIAANEVDAKGSASELARSQRDRRVRPLPQPLPTTLPASDQFAGKAPVPATLRGGGHVTRRERLPQDRGEKETTALFRAGAATVDITPQVLPVIINGGMAERTADKVVDPLHARCLVLDDGTTRIALVVVDSCMLPRDLLDQAKAMASQATGILPEHILISATHTHSAPSVMGCLGSDPDQRYRQQLPDWIVAAIARAEGNLVPARVGWAVGRDTLDVACRRWLMQEGAAPTNPFGGTVADRARMHPGYGNPKAIRPTGPVDPDVTLLAVQTRDGEPLALLANYSMHYVGAPAVSADYFAQFCGKITSSIAADQRQPHFVAMLANGTSGDIWCLDHSKPRREFDRFSVASDLADAALAAYRGIEYHAWAPIVMRQRTLTLPVRMPKADEVSRAKEFLATFSGRKPRTVPEVYARETLLLSQMASSRELVLQAIRIGQMGITAIPNEVFASTGLAIKRESPLRPTMNIGLANGSEGYIPPPEQHKLGGYTTWRARTSCLEVQAEPKIRAAVVKLLREVVQQQVSSAGTRMQPGHQSTEGFRPAPRPEGARPDGRPVRESTRKPVFAIHRPS